jgi:hypothetical protein
MRGPFGALFLLLFISMEYTWQQFTQLNEIRKLPLNEQMKRFSFYLDSVSNLKTFQTKGISKFLLQENGNFLLLESGQKIIY